MFEQTELCEALGDAFTNRVVDRLHRFAFIPNELLERLATEALTENWGPERHALKKYLAAPYCMEC